jgi:hypothetical protein
MKATRETIHCEYCGGTGELAWFQTHAHANPFANFDPITGERGDELATWTHAGELVFSPRVEEPTADEDAFHCDICDQCCDQPHIVPDRAGFCCICTNEENYVPRDACELCTERGRLRVPGFPEADHERH